MQIGKPLRTVIVEPLKLPVSDPTGEPISDPPDRLPEPNAPQAELEQVPTETMSIPDYISPVVGYRVWTWNVLGLKSLCGMSWHPGQSLAARCKASTVVGTLIDRAKAAGDSHTAPQENCTCGIYAIKTLHRFRSAGYERYGIYGEVYLWGTIVEHELGYRAQFAYPKTFVLQPGAMPFTLAEIWPRLQALTLFGSDIFVLGNGETISLWSKSSGFGAPLSHTAVE